jgi:arabinogalactan endo-1,4-beta-galactosidase
MVIKMKTKNLIIAALCAVSIVVFAVYVYFSLFTECDCCDGGRYDGSRNLPVADSVIFVERVEGLPKNFMLGADISSVLSLEESGVVFHDFDGSPSDLLELFAAGGANYIRVRVWNDPWAAPGKGFGGGNNDVPRAVEIGRRATEAGMRLLVNFHYSDFWADPGKQMSPRAWLGMDLQQRAEALYKFTYDTIIQMLESGIDVGMVQIGNETNNGIAGVTGWTNKVRLFAAGSQAVIDAERDYRVSRGERLAEDFNRNIKIAFHLTNPEDRGIFIHMAQLLRSNDITYDVFGISYYNFWHGELDGLVDLMNFISRTFDIDVAVFETSYPFTDEDTDGHTNSWSGYNMAVEYPLSVQGQAHAIRDVIAAVAAVENGKGVGVFLWEPAWITVGHGGAAANRPVWEQHGSGWASVHAAVYDPGDAGVYWGGTSWDNQAFFDRYGNPLATLNLFNYVRSGAVSRYGNGIEMIIQTESEMEFFDALTAAHIAENLLPQAVTAVFLNNERKEVNVQWSESAVNAAINQFKTVGGVTTVHINGTAAYGDSVFTATHVLTLTPGNFIRNHNFESPDMSMWRITFHGADQGYANRGTDNPRNGHFGLRWWRAPNLPMYFSVEQDINGLPPGVYGFETFITGGDAGVNFEIYAYVKINGTETARVNTFLPGWQNWNNPAIGDIRVNEGDSVTVGVSLRFENTNGAWGTLDDFFFYLISE